MRSSDILPEMPADGPTPSDLLLQRYMDDELRPAERRELEVRLQTEPELAKQLATMRGLSGVLRDAREEPAPLGVGFAERAWSRFRTEEVVPVRSLHETLRLLTLVAAVLVVVLGAAFWLLESDGPADLTASPKKSEAHKLLEELDTRAESLKMESLDGGTQAPAKRRDARK